MPKSSAISLRLAVAALLAGTPGFPAWLHAQVPAVVPYQPETRPPPLVSAPTETSEKSLDHGGDMLRKAATDSIYQAHAAGSYGYRRFSYVSRVGDLAVPAYLFQPLDISPGDRLPALIWVHGGVHSDFSAGYLPFVKEAVKRGYVVIAPDYRGSTGYGAEFYEMIDYGGYEVDDVISVVDYIRENLPHVDLDRIGIMGWSHGGLIAALAVFRDEHPFRAAVAVAPVANLVFRLSYKGPAYQSHFLRQERIGALPHERPDIYIERSPVYQVDKLGVPFMVQVATNDADVDFVESEMLLHALQVKKPDLAEIHVYENPSGGHFFSRLVDTHFQVVDTPAMRDAWDSTWRFFERHLAPRALSAN